jgi:hypothetical protein
MLRAELSRSPADRFDASLLEGGEVAGDRVSNELAELDNRYC